MGDAIAEFVGFVARTRQSAGACHAVFVPAESDHFGQVHVGYDCATECWYIASTADREAGYAGLDPSHKIFQCAGPREPDRELGAPLFGHQSGMTNYFPTLQAWMLAQRPGIVTRCEAKPEGGWNVSYTGPGGSLLTREELHIPADASYPDVDVTLGLDALGRVISLSRVDAGKLQETKFTYSAGDNSVLLPPEVAVGNMKLVTHTVESTPNMRKFERDVVRALAKQANQEVETRYQSMVIARQNEKSPASVWTLPLVGTGVICLVLGVLAWWRRSHRA